jgi:hypothetical protein
VRLTSPFCTRNFVREVFELGKRLLLRYVRDERVQFENRVFALLFACLSAEVERERGVLH